LLRVVKIRLRVIERRVKSASLIAEN
jgi:hypothetical protein